MVYSSSKYYFVGKDEKMTKFDFAPCSAIFLNLENFVNLLKPLHVKEHINNILLNKVFRNNKVMMNQLPYIICFIQGLADLMRN